jgi:hypothetical protein
VRQYIAPLLFWCLGGTVRGLTGTLGAVGELNILLRFPGRCVAVDGHRGSGEFVASGTAGRYLTPEMFEVRRRCFVLRPVRRGMVAQ